MSTLLITGTGSLAKRIMFRFREKYDKIVCVSRGEATHLDLPDWVTPEMCDIRDYDRLNYLFKTYKPEVCVHSSAFKVLGLMQKYVTECVKTNVLGTENVARVCHYYDVRQSLLIGTDKSVNPVHNQAYGLSKALARAVYVDFASRPSKTNFLITLYGNVVRSRNSFVPIWENLIKNDQPIRVAHEEATRFMFSLDDSVSLIEKVLEYDINGGCIIPIMQSYKIMDIAIALGVMLNKEVKYNCVNQLGPGEKMHEEMTSTVDDGLIYQLEPNLLCVLPSFENGVDYSKVKKTPYVGPQITSDRHINRNIDHIIDLLNRSRVD